MKRAYAQEARLEVGPVFNLEHETELIPLHARKQEESSPKLFVVREEHFVLDSRREPHRF